MKKRILGLDLGTNSIGWALIENDFDKKEGEIKGIGTRIIPMGQDVLGKFDAGQTISQTADRTTARGTRRLYQRNNLRRERLHRVLNVLNFLPQHYKDAIDFVKKYGQFKDGTEIKLPYVVNQENQHSFIFQKSFNEMALAFKANGYEENIPYDWTIYYLRKKALTQKIEKEELAWLLLNFNQKRGYYQLRGEEEADSSKEYVELNVKEVVDTGENVKGNALFKVIFENGWEYEKLITKTEDWVDKTREFIVTTSLKKDGTIKRTYKQVDSEKDWLAIKEKTQNEIDIFNSTNNTVGIASYIFDTLLKNPTQKIRGKLVKTIERKYYRTELEHILETQQDFHKDSFNAESLKKCVKELYSRNEAHQKDLLSRDFKHLFVQDIIFYQRPLKSKKSTIADCPFEYRTFVKDKILVKNALKTTSKSNPVFQEFRLWQFIQNLRIYKRGDTTKNNVINDEEVTSQYLNTENEYSTLYQKLNSLKDVNQKQLLSILSLKETTHRWNFPEEKKYPCNETRYLIATKIEKIKGLDINIIDDSDFLKTLWHLIYSVTDKKEYEKALVTFAQKNDIPIDDFVEQFKKIPPFESSYASYSEKALKKLLTLMRMNDAWSIEAISLETKQRIENIIVRLNSKDVNYDISKLEQVADDDIPKSVLKSFAKEKNRLNPFKGLNTYQACYAVYNRHSELGDIVQWKRPEDIDNYLKEFKQHSLRNPIVEQVILETLRVVRDIWKSSPRNLKESPFFDEIHIELGREMKNDKKTRERISKSNTEKENTNERIKALLEEIKQDPNITDDVRPYSPSHQEILKIYEDGIVASKIEIEDSIEKIRRSNKPTKAEIIKYKIWLEQGYISPYTGKPIPLSKLFSTAYQIEHIIPQSRYFDNSMSNKIICESAVNEEKDNKTAFEFIKEKGGSLVDIGHGKSVALLTLTSYENHCRTYFKKNKNKLELLLSEDIPEGFINRQLNDSRYISKVVKTLLSNIVREDGELETTSKNLIPLNGAITSKLKNDWGLNDKWNELIAPRFKRLNELTQTEEFGFYDHTINTFRSQVPKELEKNFSKKRIDHRHHALDALVIACTTRDHVNYITSLNTERHNHSLVKKLRQTEQIIDNNGSKRTVAKEFLHPWHNFTSDAKNELEKIIVTFKQNTRVINKTNNKTWQWREENGVFKKKLVKQEKGQNWAIRKSMHKATVSGLVNMNVPNGKIATATRIDLAELKTRKRLESITDISIQKILNNHLKDFTNEKGQEDFENAFNQDGVERLNSNIKFLNSGKLHQPIKKVRIYEIGSKFAIGETGQKATKYVEADKGTNLFFNIYWDSKKQQRAFETVPLNEVIAHQKQTAHLPKSERTNAPISKGKGELLFSLSPNDLVFVPLQEEIDNPRLIDTRNLVSSQIERIYKMNDSSGVTCYFTPITFSKSIAPKEIDKNFDLKTAKINDVSIKDVCWKIKTNRIGEIIRIIK